MVTEAEKINEVRAEVGELMDWDDSRVLTWLGTPMEELGLKSPFELIISGQGDKLDMFIAGMKKAMHSEVTTKGSC